MNNTVTTLQPIRYTKRVGHLFEHVRDLDNLKAAIRDAAKHKRKRKAVQEALADIDNRALELQKMLDEETFVPSRYTIREINDGIRLKKRFIAVPKFWPDQCIHHAFIRVFKQVVMHSASPFSCGCVPGKGTRAAKDLITKWIRNDPKHTKHVAVTDVKQCYPTISHRELRRKLHRRIKDRKFLRLAYKFIASFQQPMITHEEMLPEDLAVGLPIGLFTSPWFCNFYFQELDHKIMEKIGVAHNVRYVDDVVFFDSSKRRLHNAVRIIASEVEKMYQRIKHTWQVFKLEKRPLDFLGFRFYTDHVSLRKSIMLRISRKARRIYRAGYVSIRNAHAMVSYDGWIQNSDSQDFSDKWVTPYVSISHLKEVIAHEDRKQLKTAVAV